MKIQPWIFYDRQRCGVIMFNADMYLSVATAGGGRWFMIRLALNGVECRFSYN